MFVNKIYIIVFIFNFGDFNFDEFLGIIKVGKNDIFVKIFFLKKNIKK